MDLVHPKAPMPWVILHPLEEQPHCWVSICNPFSLKTAHASRKPFKLQPGLFSERTFPAPFNPRTSSSSWSLPLKGNFPSPAQGSQGAWKVQFVSLEANPWDAGKFSTMLPHLCWGPPPTDDLSSLAEQNHRSDASRCPEASLGLLNVGTLLGPPRPRNWEVSNALNIRVSDLMMQFLSNKISPKQWFSNPFPPLSEDLVVSDTSLIITTETRCWRHLVVGVRDAAQHPIRPRTDPYNKD